jgi:signal transduction histidine kinase/ActR/RegA family two-component response regulator
MEKTRSVIEELLEGNEGAQNTILDSIPGALFVVETGYKLIEMNRGAFDLTGISDSEFSHVLFTDLLMEDETTRVKNAFEELESTASICVSTRIKGVHGCPVQCILTAKKVADSKGKMLGSVWTALPSGETGDSLRSIFTEEMLNGFCLCESVVDEEGRPVDFRFLDINERFSFLTGAKRNCIGKTVKEVLPWLKRYFIGTFKAIEKTGHSRHSVRYFRKVERYFEMNAFCPKKHQMVVYIADITESRKAEEEKKNLQSQLIQSQKLEAIGRLAGGIAHDFNNLLTAILGYTDLALIQLENRHQLKEHLNQIRFATQRAAKLVHQLLIFSREEPMEFKPHNLTDIIENLLKMLKRIIGEDIRILLDLERELLASRMDQGQIEQVIMNLAINARDAMYEGGTLTIRTSNVIIDSEYLKTYSYARTGRFVQLSMEDTGIGMDKLTIQKVFEPFFTTKKTGEGTGLGLSVVYGIIKEHQGWINVSSKPGKGSKFTIYLPACSERPSSDKQLDRACANLQGEGGKILLVEDDETIRKFMETQLKKNGYTVVTAETGARSMEIIKKEKESIDLLFTDVVLPDIRGVELVDKMLAYNPNLKVLFTSGYLDKKSEWPYIRRRNFKFIEKPYTLFELLKSLRETLTTPGL